MTRNLTYRQARRRSHAREMLREYLCFVGLVALAAGLIWLMWG